MVEQRAVKKTVKKGATNSQAVKKPQTNVPPIVQEALQVTWLLKGGLKNVQLAYIRVGKLLAQVRDRKLWEALKHPDIESYAQERLQLGRSSLYRYLQVYDWMVECHKDWLEPHPKGFIPELSDAADLMWIEGELAKKNLEPEKRAALEALRQKGLNGQLKDSDVAKYRRQASPTDAGLKTLLSKLRALRRTAAQLAAMPPEAVADLDAAIHVIEKAVATAGKGRRPSAES